MPCDQNDFTSSPAIRFRMQECFQSQRRFHKTRRRAKPGHVGLYASRRERIAPKKNARDRESQSGSPTRNQKKRSLRTRSNRARNCSRVISTAARGKSKRWNSSWTRLRAPESLHFQDEPIRIALSRSAHDESGCVRRTTDERADVSLCSLSRTGGRQVRRAIRRLANFRIAGRDKFIQRAIERRPIFRGPH
jgi:hypothetical protein